MEGRVPSLVHFSVKQHHHLFTPPPLLSSFSGEPLAVLKKHHHHRDPLDVLYKTPQEILRSATVGRRHLRLQGHFPANSGLVWRNEHHHLVPGRETKRTLHLGSGGGGDGGEMEAGRRWKAVVNRGGRRWYFWICLGRENRVIVYYIFTL